MLQECAHRFPVPLYGNENQKNEKFILTSAPENLKCMLSLTGDSITHAVNTQCRDLLVLTAAHNSNSIRLNAAKNYFTTDL